jgi:hypothetical protein
VLSITANGKARVEILSGPQGAGYTSYLVKSGGGELPIGPYSTPARIRIRPAAGVTVTYLDDALKAPASALVNRETGAPNGKFFANGQVFSGSVSATIAGSGIVGEAITATLPASMVGTLQFTRTLKTSPFTKTNIAGAVANVVNSLQYTPVAGDTEFFIGCDSSNIISSSNNITAMQPGNFEAGWATRMWGSGSANVQSASAAFLLPQPVQDGELVTHMHVFELLAHADFIQPLFANYDQATPMDIQAVKVVCVPALGDLKYDALFAALPDAPISGGSTTTTVAVRGGAGSNETNPRYKFSDPLPITTVNRTDFPSRGPLVAIRIVERIANRTAQRSFWKPVGADWDTDPGRVLTTARVGDFRTTPIDAAPAGQSAFRQCQMLGFRVHYTVPAKTFAGFGSSLKAADLDAYPNKRMFGMIAQAAAAASTTDKPVEYMNMGQAGQQLINSVAAAEQLLPLTKPTIAMIEVLNINSITSNDTSDAVMNSLRVQSQQFIAAAEAVGSYVVIDNSWGRNTSTAPQTASYFTAAATTKHNAYLQEFVTAGREIFDTRTLMNTGAVPDAVKMIASGYSFDGVVADGVHQTAAAASGVLKTYAQGRGVAWAARS